MFWWWRRWFFLFEFGVDGVGGGKGSLGVIEFEVRGRLLVLLSRDVEIE